MTDIKDEIMNQSRHQFIYCYNDEKRKKIIDEILKEYPVVCDEDKPIAIKVNDFGIPNYKINFEGVDYNKLFLIGNEYFELATFDSILKRTIEAYDEDFLNERLSSIFELFNRNTFAIDPIEIKDIKSLLSAVEESKKFYHGSYKEYVETGREYKPIDTITLPFIQLELLIKMYKEAINNKSYFGFIIDKQGPTAKSSMMATNLYIGSRNNDDFSMKVFTDIDDWNCFKTSNGQLVQFCHDYGEVELDDSVKKYVKDQMKMMHNGI